jgi:endonuclease III
MKKSILELAKEVFEEEQKRGIDFAKEDEVNELLKDLKHHPHAFVLGCLMDRQTKAEKAWRIPYEVFKATGAKDIKSLSAIKEKEYIKLFNKKKLHTYHNKMGPIFYKGVMKIKQDYKGDASLIWAGKPSSATVVRRFLEFEGAGPKIATMAANILVRQYKIPFSDLSSIDISPDVHVRRVMKRLGYVSKDDNMIIMYKARELNPEFPGIFDILFWRVGNEHCKEQNPDCGQCPICEACEKVF